VAELLTDSRLEHRDRAVNFLCRWNVRVGETNESRQRNLRRSEG
jgi:hypothetical protein